MFMALHRQGCACIGGQGGAGGMKETTHRAKGCLRDTDEPLSASGVGVAADRESAAGAVAVGGSVDEGRRRGFIRTDEEDLLVRRGLP